MRRHTSYASFVHTHRFMLLLIREEEEPLLDVLRGQNSVRIKNCELNTGKKLYAFNALQREVPYLQMSCSSNLVTCTPQALPAELRPPHGTYGSGKS